MPERFARGMGRLIKQYASTPTGSIPSQTSQAPPQQPWQQPQQQPPIQGHSNSNNLMPSQGNTLIQQPQATPNHFASTHSPSQQPTSPRILFVVQSGGDFHLVQIPVNGINTRDFFLALCSEYFKLRGFIRRYLSVWHYSHCDFYRVRTFKFGLPYLFWPYR